MKLICAPMATLSHEAFRLAIERFGGCDEYYTEMINAGSLLTRGPFEKYYLLSGPVPQKIVWQITGHKADSIVQAAAVLAEQGGTGIDLNMGCSAPQIANGGAGISWMLKPIDETAELVRGVKAALVNAAHDGTQPLRLSVKIRLGDVDFTDEGFFAFCDMLASEGVTQITLHPRTKKEKYRLPARWEYVERLAERLGSASGRADPVSIILNGDVCDAASARAALKTAPHADGIMIARAAAQKPWIFSELRAALAADGVQFAGAGVCLAVRTATDRGAALSAENVSTDGTGACLSEKLPTDAGAPVIVRDASGAVQIDLQQLALDYISDVERCQPPEFYKTRLQRFFTYYCMNFLFWHYAQTELLNAKDTEESRARLINYFLREPGDRYKAAPWLQTGDPA